MSVTRVIGTVFRALGKGVLNVLALFLGFLLLGFLAAIAFRWIELSYSSPAGFIVYSIIPLILIFLGSLVWALVISPLIEDRRDRHRPDPWDEAERQEREPPEP
jgi:TRAP-type C4-dicarboxylate transport system permease small subunit